MSPAPETQDPKVLELAERMAGKSSADQAKLLREFAKTNYGNEFNDSPTVQLTDEQLQRIFSGVADETKKVVKEAAAETEQRYNLNHGHAKDLSEREVYSALDKQRHSQRDLEMAAKVVRSIAHAARGSAKAGELDGMYDEERNYMKETGRESRAMSIGTDTTGGYLGGELFETMMYDNVARVSQARKYCTIVNMTKEILRLPKLTTSYTAEQTSEAGTITASQWVLDQFVLNTKKLNVLTKPFSVELLETADPALVQQIIQFASIEIAKKEDALVFATSGTGILGHSTNNVILGGSASSGSMTINDVTFDDLHNMINELDEQYLPDEDIKGSGLIGGEARFWMPRTVINVLAKSKGNDNYHWANVQELKMGKRVHGFELKRVVSMSQAPAVTTRFGAFGNLAHVWCGVRPGFRIELMSQGSVDSVNLNETNSYALRVTEFFDNDCIDDESLSIAKTATT